MFASGLRNPVGLAYFLGTNTLWTAVNERDHLGDDLVPDYITSGATETAERMDQNCGLDQGGA